MLYSIALFLLLFLFLSVNLRVFAWFVSKTSFTLIRSTNSLLAILTEILSVSVFKSSNDFTECSHKFAVIHLQNF